MCDLLRFRHRLGRDLASEALRDYLKRPRRRINTMLEYAAKPHVLGRLRASLEALL